MPTLTTQMTKALDTWTPTGCQGELLRADEVNLYYQNARLGRVDYMSKEFVETYYKQGGKGQIKEGHPDLCYYDSKGKAVVPYMRVLIRR